MSDSLSRLGAFGVAGREIKSKTEATVKKFARGVQAVDWTGRRSTESYKNVVHRASYHTLLE